MKDYTLEEENNERSSVARKNGEQRKKGYSKKLKRNKTKKKLGKNNLYKILILMTPNLGVKKDIIHLLEDNNIYVEKE